jgi:hypothetical protein
MVGATNQLSKSVAGITVIQVVSHHVDRVKNWPLTDWSESLLSGLRPETFKTKDMEPMNRADPEFRLKLTKRSLEGCAGTKWAATTPRIG